MANRTGLPFDLLLERGSDEPMHRQIYLALRKYILEGRLRANANLPGSRLLAEHLAVGRNTVLSAYDQLLAEGWVEARSGSGTFVVPLSSPPEARPAKISAAQLEISRRGELIAAQSQPCRTPGRLSLYPGVPETRSFPFPAWSRLLAEIARRRDEDLLTIQNYSGCLALRRTIAEYLGIARGVECSADQVVVVTGAQAALDLIGRILMDEGDDVWMEEPGYLGARGALLAAGARLWPLRVGRAGWSLDDPDLPPPRLVYVTPSCQWPLGTVMRMEERLRLLGLAARHEAWIIEDDYDGEYRFHGRPIPALRGLAGSDRVIYVGSFGKTMFPSLRLGFVVVPRELSGAFDRALSVTGQFAPTSLQAAVAEFIRQGRFANHLKKMRRVYARRQECFVRACRGQLAPWIRIEENDSGMQLLGQFTTAMRDREVVEAAARRGLDLQAVSINYFRDPPVHGLLFGYAAVNEEETETAVAALRETFRSLEAPAPSSGSSGRGRGGRGRMSLATGRREAERHAILKRPDAPG